MALPSLTISSFTGSLLINSQTDLFSQYLSEFYPLIARDCIGDASYVDVFLTSPLPQKYVDLFVGNNYYHVATEKQAVNQGVTSAIKQFMWAQFQSDNFIPTNAGMKKAIGENSDRVSDASMARLVQNRYNEGALIMRNVLRFVMNYMNYKQPITGFVDNTGGSFTIQTSATLYLADGDTVTIDGVEYDVSNVVADTSFNIESDSVSSFIGVYISNPFQDVCIGRLEAMI